MGREILASDLDIDVDFSDETTRQLFANRLSGEIAGQPWTSDLENVPAGQKRLSRDDAVDILEHLFRKMNEAEKTNAGYVRRAVLSSQDKFEEVAGQPIDEALEEVYDEYEEARTLARWFLG